MRKSLLQRRNVTRRERKIMFNLENSMNKLKLIMPFIGIFFVLVTAALSSCQKDETETVSVIITDDTEIGIGFIEDALTPNSCTFETFMNYGKYVVISPEKPVVENFIERVKETLDVSDLYEEYQQEGNLSVQRFHKDWSNLLICYDLSPDTKYYYVTIDNVEWKSIVISNVKNFTTPKYDSMVDLGLSVNWCGYNYVEGESEMKIWDNDLYYYSNRPHQFDNMFQNCRYPKEDEVKELINNTEITLVDYNKRFIRLTSVNGNNIYIPFDREGTNKWQQDNLALFPYLPNGTFVDIDKMPKPGIMMGGYPYPMISSSDVQLTGSRLKDFHIIMSDTFYKAYSGVTENGNSRGVRLVCDK